MLRKFLRTITLDDAGNNLYFGLFLGTSGPFLETVATDEVAWVDHLLQAYPSIKKTFYVRLAYDVRPTSWWMNFYGENLVLKRSDETLEKVEDGALLIFRTQSGIVCGLCQIQDGATPESVPVYLDDPFTKYVQEGLTEKDSEVYLYLRPAVTAEEIMVDLHYSWSSEKRLVRLPELLVELSSEKIQQVEKSMRSLLKNPSVGRFNPDASTLGMKRP